MSTPDLLFKADATQGYLAALADRFAGAAVASAVADHKDLNGVCYLPHEAAGGTGTRTYTVQKCDSDGSNGTAIPFRYRVNGGAITQATAAGFTTTAGANQVVQIFVDSRDLGSKRYSKLVSDEVVDSAVLGGVICLQFPKVL